MRFPSGTSASRCVVLPQGKLFKHLEQHSELIIPPTLNSYPLHECLLGKGGAAIILLFPSPESVPTLLTTHTTCPVGFMQFYRYQEVTTGVILQMRTSAILRTNVLNGLITVNTKTVAQSSDLNQHVCSLNKFLNFTF